MGFDDRRCLRRHRDGDLDLAARNWNFRMISGRIGRNQFGHRRGSADFMARCGTGKMIGGPFRMVLPLGAWMAWHVHIGQRVPA